METDADVEEVNVVKKQNRILQGNIRTVMWVTAVLFVLTLLSLIRSFQLQDSVQEIDDHTDELTNISEQSREAAIEARDRLNGVLDNLEQQILATGDGASIAAIAEALSAIHRIEANLCGGPCGN